MRIHDRRRKCFLVILCHYFLTNFRTTPWRWTQDAANHVICPRVACHKTPAIQLSNRPQLIVHNYLSSQSRLDSSGTVALEVGQWESRRHAVSLLPAWESSQVDDAAGFQYTSNVMWGLALMHRWQFGTSSHRVLAYNYSTNGNTRRYTFPLISHHYYLYASCLTCPFSASHFSHSFSVRTVCILIR